MGQNFWILILELGICNFWADALCVILDYLKTFQSIKKLLTSSSNLSTLVMATWTSPFRVSNFRLSHSVVLSSYCSKDFKSSFNFTWLFFMVLTSCQMVSRQSFTYDSTIVFHVLLLSSLWHIQIKDTNRNSYMKN